MHRTKPDAVDAVARFYRTLIEMGMDDSDVPDLQIMLPVSDVRAIIRDRNALRMGLNDWLVTYVPDFCDEDHVIEAQQRIDQAGGTIAYITDLLSSEHKEAKE